MLCTAGNATPSPAPSKTRAAMAGAKPCAAAAGVRKVKRDQRRMPACGGGGVVIEGYSSDVSGLGGRELSFISNAPRACFVCRVVSLPCKPHLENTRAAEAVAQVTPDHARDSVARKERAKDEALLGEGPVAVGWREWIGWIGGLEFRSSAGPSVGRSIGRSWCGGLSRRWNGQNALTMRTTAGPRPSGGSTSRGSTGPRRRWRWLCVCGGLKQSVQSIPVSPH